MKSPSKQASKYETNTQVEKFNPLDTEDNDPNADRSRNKGVKEITTKDLPNIDTEQRLNYIDKNWVKDEEEPKQTFVEAINFNTFHNSSNEKS